MKTILLTIAIYLSFGIASAQQLKNSDVPENVTAAFAKKYPGATAKWEKEGADYEAEFDLNKTESSAVFNPGGEFKKLEHKIKLNELPKIVMEYCTKNFTGYKIEEAAKITEASGKILYEAGMKKGAEKFDALFDEKGNFVRK